MVADMGAWNLIKSTIDPSLHKYLEWGLDGKINKSLMLKAETNDPAFLALLDLVLSGMITHVETTNNAEVKLQRDDPRGSHAVLNIKFYFESPTAYAAGITATKLAHDVDVLLWKDGLKIAPEQMVKTTAHELYGHAWLAVKKGVDPADHSPRSEFDRRLTLVYSWYGWKR